MAISVRNPLPVKLFRSPRSLQRAARAWQRDSLLIGLVPTMGYLHAGHISLVREARRRVGPAGKVVVSIYVNPTQFAPHEDLATYPRDLPGDLRRCREAGVDAVFLPTDANMYPGTETGLYSTYVMEERLSQGLEGSSRPNHFRGVTTIVAKLFHCALPDVAVFGAKDWQQAAVVRRMTQDLNFPVRIVVAPIHREPDGLAMSSRNVYLTPKQRTEATILSRCIRGCRERVRRAGEVSSEELVDWLRHQIAENTEGRLDYAVFMNGETLESVSVVRRGTHLALAVFLGRVRLLDNGGM